MILNFTIAVTQRFAFNGSAAGKGFWEEGYYYRLVAFELRY
jgi:hypothetical protein|tara:strand:+ start:908 stop:1030 length:123 start_codon:yes stop_codon:yes gene_type:complete